MKKNIIDIALGLVIATVGIILLIHSHFGLDPLGALVNSLSILTTIPYGTVLPIINILFLIFIYIKNKNLKFCLIGLLMSVVMGVIINISDLFIYLLPNEYILQKIIIFLVGFLLMCLGIALIQRGRIQKLPFEGMQQTIADMVNKDINVIRVYVEITLGIIAILIFVLIMILNIEVNVFETINIGTPFIMLLTGPTVNVMYKKLLKGE